MDIGLTWYSNQLKLFDMLNKETNTCLKPLLKLQNGCSSGKYTSLNSKVIINCSAWNPPWHGNALHIIDPLGGETTSHWIIPNTNDPVVYFVVNLKNVDQTVNLPLISEAMALCDDIEMIHKGSSLYLVHHTTQDQKHAIDQYTEML